MVDAREATTPSPQLSAEAALDAAGAAGASHTCLALQLLYHCTPFRFFLILAPCLPCSEVGQHPGLLPEQVRQSIPRPARSCRRRTRLTQRRPPPLPCVCTASRSPGRRTPSSTCAPRPRTGRRSRPCWSRAGAAAPAGVPSWGLLVGGLVKPVGGPPVGGTSAREGGRRQRRSRTALRSS